MERGSEDRMNTIVNDSDVEDKRAMRRPCMRWLDGIKEA